MKKILTCLITLSLLTACSDKKSEEQTTTEASDNPQVSLNKMPNIDYAKKTFSFSKDSLAPGCEEDSEITCAINLALKCTINPQFAECDKAKMPKFIFMEDESLERPTEATYKITKMKPIAEGQVEIYTTSTCNGSWFGLCDGNIIYVMAQKNNSWIVKDLYARAHSPSGK